VVPVSVLTGSGLGGLVDLLFQLLPAAPQPLPAAPAARARWPRADPRHARRERARLDRPRSRARGGGGPLRRRQPRGRGLPAAPLQHAGVNKLLAKAGAVDRRRGADRRRRFDYFDEAAAEAEAKALPRPPSAPRPGTRSGATSTSTTTRGTRSTTTARRAGTSAAGTTSRGPTPTMPLPSGEAPAERPDPAGPPRGPRRARPRTAIAGARANVGRAAPPEGARRSRRPKGRRRPSAPTMSETVTSAVDPRFPPTGPCRRVRASRPTASACARTSRASASSTSCGSPSWPSRSPSPTTSTRARCAPRCWPRSSTTSPARTRPRGPVRPGPPENDLERRHPWPSTAAPAACSPPLGRHRRARARRHRGPRLRPRPGDRVGMAVYIADVSEPGRGVNPASGRWPWSTWNVPTVARSGQGALPAQPRQGRPPAYPAGA
jgi:hypothetical protein